MFRESGARSRTYLFRENSICVRRLRLRRSTSSGRTEEGRNQQRNPTKTDFLSLRAPFLCHCERKRSNRPVLQYQQDCLVATASRNDTYIVFVTAIAFIQQQGHGYRAPTKFALCIFQFTFPVRDTCRRSPCTTRRPPCRPHKPCHRHPLSR